MSSPSDQPELLPAEDSEQGEHKHPFRRAVLRGLAMVMPPLLTIVIFLWAWGIIDAYVLQPIERGARQIVIWSIRDVHDSAPSDSQRLDYEDGSEGFSFKGEKYVRIAPDKNKWIPLAVRDTVAENPGESRPTNANEFYQRFVEIRYLKRRFVLPFFLCLFILALYFLGKFLAAGMGRIFWNFGEAFIHRVPIIRTVYSSAKQVTDFVFSERDIQYTRVVAVEYPRKGVWSVGFVTGESMKDLRIVAKEPVVSVLMPTSPMPATGFTITVPKRETVELNLTIDQAIQFIVSCGVVVPAQQQQIDEQIEEIAAGLEQTALEASQATRPSQQTEPTKDTP